MLSDRAWPRLKIHTQTAPQNFFHFRRHHQKKLVDVRLGGFNIFAAHDRRQLKKSPTSTTCRPPNGASMPRMRRHDFSTSENVRADNIEISSITKTFAFKIRRIPRLLRPMASMSYFVSSVFHAGRRLQEWIVMPPICVAAMPVDAVMATSMPRSRKPSRIAVDRMRLATPPVRPSKKCSCRSLKISKA